MRILLLGPTGVGKTNLSVGLAKELKAEIISADSRQCYKYMNIGTATPTMEERAGIPHYNLSIIEPSARDSVADYYERAINWTADIQSRNKTVMYVGGSTLHQQCMIRPLDDIPDASKSNIEELERRIKTEGLPSLFAKLQAVDPDYAGKMDGMNPQRIIRALDVWMQTGRPFSSFHSDEARLQPPDDLMVVGLNRQRSLLYERINKRTEQMLNLGLLDEVRSLLDRGFTLADPGLNTVGYKQAIHHLAGKCTAEHMLKDIQTQTRRYAKRQLTWFRRWPFIHWLNLDGLSHKEALKNILQYLAAKSNKE